MDEQRILELARAAGLAQEWTSATGQPMKVAPEALARILEALQLPCGSEQQCRDSHARLKEFEGNGRLLPMITGTVGEAVTLPDLPALAGQPYRIEFESGGHVEGQFDADASAGFHIPALDGYGYHRLLVGDMETTLAVAPRKCFGVADTAPSEVAERVRLWGLGVQLYSLRRKGDGGYGDYTALSEFAQQAAKKGAAAVAISPVHAMFSADVHRFSPYGPSSRLFFNVLHIDPAAVLGPHALQSVLDELGGDTRAELARLEQTELIDWPAAAALRLRILRKLYARFREHGKRSEFDAFIEKGGEALQSHARFEALHGWKIARGEDAWWRNWPDELRDPRSAAVQAFAREHAEEVEFHAFLQWQAARGLELAQRNARRAGMPIGLITDLAVGADNGGSQAWSRQREIITGLSVGAPPDAMNPKGQGWGLGAFSPHAMKAQGYHAYIEMLRAAFAHAGGVRIDHVLGLMRLWLVPDGAAPSEGAYLHYPCQDLLRLVALESWRHRAIVIGEDLGTVPEGFDKLLADAGLLGMRVLLFQRDGQRFLQPREWPSIAISTTTTHDLPTLAGWWKETDIGWRSKLDLLEAGQREEAARSARVDERRALWQALQEGGFAPRDAVQPQEPPLREAAGLIGAALAPLAMLPVEDALGLVEQPNLPGTIDSHPNWRRRLPTDVTHMLDDPEVQARLENLNHLRTRAGDPQK